MDLAHIMAPCNEFEKTTSQLARCLLQINIPTYRVTYDLYRRCWCRIATELTSVCIVSAEEFRVPLPFFS